MALARDVGMDAGLAYATSREPIAVPISLNIMSPLVAAFDMTWIVSLSLFAGMLYDATAFGGAGDVENHLGVGLGIAALYTAFGRVMQLYHAQNLLRLRWQYLRVATNWLMAFGFLAVLAFLMKSGTTFSRGGTVSFFCSGLVLTVVLRWAVYRLCRLIISSGALKPNRIVVIGVKDQLASNQALFTMDQYGYAVACVFELPEGANGADDLKSLKAGLREVVQYVRKFRIDEVVLAIRWQSTGLLAAIETELRVLPIPVKLIPDTTTSQVFGRPLIQMGQTKAIQLQRAPLSLFQRGLKQAMDRIASGIALVLLMPFFAVIAAAIRLESAGPALFLQTRVGFNGQPFRILKFRTMVTLDNGPTIIQATKDDRRVTHLGRLLRKLSIDEVPQLLNVLRGDMSLVGPRPHALAHDNEYDQLIATYAIRHKMKPGITGWAQVNGFRGETPEVAMMAQRVESDLWYIECWSPWLDIRIMLLTLVRILKPQNVY